jgi:hypothetical protein
MNRSVIAVLAVMITVFCVTACASPEPAIPEQPRTWRPVASWTGSGIKESETFAISEPEWRIRWATSNERLAGAGILQIMVHNADTKQLITLAANKQGIGDDVSYVRSGPGRFYVVMNSGNVDWSVTAEQ